MQNTLQHTDKQVYYINTWRHIMFYLEHLKTTARSSVFKKNELDIVNPRGHSPKRKLFM